MDKEINNTVFYFASFKEKERKSFLEDHITNPDYD